MASKYSGTATEHCHFCSYSVTQTGESDQSESDARRRAEQAAIVDMASHVSSVHFHGRDE